MKLHSVSFKNFKSFKDETTIPLSQTTCLIGPNGAGKSNVLYGLKTLSAIITKNEYAPAAGDYFDNDTTQDMGLTAVMELSDDERRKIAHRIKTPSAALSDGHLGDWLFKYLKYEISFSGQSKSHTVSLTFTDEQYHTFISIAHNNGKYTAQRRNVEMIHMIAKSLPMPQSYEARLITMPALLKQIDASLVSHTNDLFSGIVHTTTQRSIPKSTPAHESHGITPDGANILNELNDLSRQKQLEFDEFLSFITDGSLTSIEPKMRDSALSLEATEPDLNRRTPHTDFGSGQEQLVLLALQLFVRRGTAFMLTEPELHLHANAQKRIKEGLKIASSKLQIVIETHSPIFLSTDRNEAVVLITKDRGCSRATPISADNMDVIRHDLGITHHDSLHHENILFVEGSSEHTAFPKFLSTLEYDYAPRTAVFNMGGVGRIKHLRLLLSYFKADGRKVFVILDANKAVRPYVKKLKDDGLLDKNLFIMEKNFEDAFASTTIIETVAKMALPSGYNFPLTADDLDSERARDERVDAILQKHWKTATGRDFSKVDLAVLLADLPSNDIPEEIKSALQAAMAYFGQDNGNDPAGGGETGARQA